MIYIIKNSAYGGNGEIYYVNTKISADKILEYAYWDNELSIWDNGEEIHTVDLDKNDLIKEKGFIGLPYEAYEELKKVKLFIKTKKEEEEKLREKEKEQNELRELARLMRKYKNG